MKTQLMSLSAAIFSIAIIGTPLIIADNPTPLAPLPVFIPNAPDKNKAVSSYNAVDVFSTVVTCYRPEGHPIENIYTKGAAKLKSEWSGAKDSTQIDAMLNLVLGAATVANRDDVWKSLLDIRFIIYSVMDLTDLAKADAICRIADQQTDTFKRRIMAEFASKIYTDLYDPRLLIYELDYIDDLTEKVHPPMHEGLPRTFSTVGNGIWNTVSRALGQIGFDPNSTPTLTSDLAASKASFKAWMTTHLSEATLKCNAYKASPEFSVNTPDLHVWAARP